MQELLWNIDAFDRAVVQFIATNLQHPWPSAFFNLITDSSNWRIPLIAVWVGLLIFGGKKGRTCALLMLPLFALSDFGSAKILKPLFGRWRPFGHFGYAMPSVHAANAFAIATLLSLFFKNGYLRVALFSIATLVAVSRVYIGVHYPTDVITGALLGTIEALIVFFGWRRFERWWKYDRLLSADGKRTAQQ